MVELFARTTSSVLILLWITFLGPGCTTAFLNHHIHRHVNHLPITTTHNENSRCHPRQKHLKERPQNGRNHPTSALFSLQNMVEEIAASTEKKTIFVGGKGGVGKTTISSALAVQLASMHNLKTLIITTDPASSLGDALDENLKSMVGKPLIMTDPLTGGRLSAMEVNAEAALDEFRESLAGFDVERLAESLGIDTTILEGLGLREFSNLLNNPPPGLDELVALGNVMDESMDYDVVVVDTAPTGHTLRLLALPQFLDGLLGKLIKLRMKLQGLTNTLQAFLGDSGAAERAQTIDNAMDRVELFRSKIGRLESRLTNEALTNFLVVTIPTKLAVAESKRLVADLTSQSIAVKDIVVNQCIGDVKSGGEADEAMINYYNRRRTGQQKWLEKLREAAAGVSGASEYQSNGSPEPIAVSELPFFDVELVGVPALGYVGSQEFADKECFSYLMEEDNSDVPKVVVCGGKGGVGKTTTSSALAITMAAKGHNVALISTDPAHSLGDAVAMDLKGGKLQDCSLVGVPGVTGQGSLSVMEIDPSSALGDFKAIVNQLLNGANMENGELSTTLQDLESIFDTLPAGTDEVVALAQVINLVKKGDYDRIVLDTAPTGHTLRMLSTPGFLAELIDQLLGIATKVASNSMVKMFLSSKAANPEDMETAASAAKSKLISFQLKMYDLEDMFSDPKQTEFLIVTIATELAVRESVRLLNDLTFEAPDMPIKVRNIIANQVLKQDGSDTSTFLSRLSDGQTKSLAALEADLTKYPSPPKITQVNYLDTEPRGVFGLKVLAEALVRETEASSLS